MNLSSVQAAVVKLLHFHPVTFSSPVGTHMLLVALGRASSQIFLHTHVLYMDTSGPS